MCYSEKFHDVIMEIWLKSYLKWVEGNLSHFDDLSTYFNMSCTVGSDIYEFCDKKTFLQSDEIKQINVLNSSLLGEEIYAERLAMMKSLGNLINDCDTEFVEKTAIGNSEWHSGNTKTQKRLNISNFYPPKKACWSVVLIAKGILNLWVVVVMFHWKNRW